MNKRKIVNKLIISILLYLLYNQIVNHYKPNNGKIFKNNFEIQIKGENISTKINDLTFEDFLSFPKNYVTVVACYFKINKSKFNATFYENWIMNFLKSVNSPLVIYTDFESQDKIKEIRGFLPIDLVLYNSIWDQMKELEKERNRSYVENYQNVQPQIDREEKIHSSELYAIWNLKSFMTKKVALRNPFNSSFFIYADAGAWREGITSEWPNIFFAKDLKNMLKDRILFSQIADTEQYPESDWVDIFEGGFFAGNREAIVNFSDSFWNIHDELLDKGHFIGKDQKIMNIYAIQKNRDRVVRLRTWNVSCSRNYDPWFFFIKFLGFATQFNCQDKRESLLINLPK